MPTITKPIILNETGINIATANARTAAALEAIAQLMAQDGGGGEGSGKDGFSPIVTITDITGGHRVSIQDATSTKTFDVMDGADGVSPTVTVTNITGGHRVAITDATGTKTFDVMDGSEGGGASVTYVISMSNNVITLTGSDGQTSSVTLPVYNGGIS